MPVCGALLFHVTFQKSLKGIYLIYKVCVKLYTVFKQFENEKEWVEIVEDIVKHILKAVFKSKLAIFWRIFEVIFNR